MLCVMADMSVSAARSRLADVIDDARVHHAPVFLTRRGRRVACLIRFLQRRYLRIKA